MATLNDKVHVGHQAVEIVRALQPIIPGGYWLYLFNMETDDDKPIYLGGPDIKKNEGIVLPSGP